VIARRMLARGFAATQIARCAFVVTVFLLGASPWIVFAGSSDAARGLGSLDDLSRAAYSG
jgi:hypothetical protein